MLIFLNKLKHIAARVTAEAVINLPLRIDVEAGALLFVKRAERHVIAARAFEWEIAADDLNDVAGSAHLFEGIFRNQPGHGAI